MQTLQAIIPLVVPLVSGLVGALALALKDRRVAHDQRAVRTNALAEATAEVTFAREWWSAHQTLGASASPESTARAMELLANAEAKVAGVQAMPAEEREGVTFDRLFLFRKLHGAQAKILKAFFWVSIAFVAMAAITISMDASSSADHGEVASDIVLGVVCLLLVPVFHEAAEAADRRASRKEAAPGTPSAQVAPRSVV